MAYTRTLTHTRPNTGVELPKVSDAYSDVDTIRRTKWADAGLVKTYTWDADELVLEIAIEADNKAAVDAVVTEMNTITDYTASKDYVIAESIARGITIMLTDSDGSSEVIC